MALQIQTNEGDEGENNLEEWLKKHRLTKAKSKLIEQEVVLQDLVELADEFDNER